MGMSQSKLVKYDTPVYYQIKKILWSEMYARYWKINQASWFSRRGNIEPHKTESGEGLSNRVATNNQVVVANVLKMYVKDVNKQ